MAASCYMPADKELSLSQTEAACSKTENDSLLQSKQYIKHFIHFYWLPSTQ